MWHNPDTGEFKIFGNKGWEPAGGGGIVNVLWKELKELKDSAKLIPGMQYRITDYVATTDDTESRSANHPFDIIVTADDTNVLNENARAIQHEGDEYFKHCNLAAWKLKYCIDNDTHRFAWALKEFDGYEIINELGSFLAELISDKDTTFEGYNYHFATDLFGVNIYIYTNTLNVEDTNTDEPILCYIKVEETEELIEIPLYSIKYKTKEGGKGVIYEMIDEHNNRAPYDFKGIQFKRYNGYVEKYPDISVSSAPRMSGIVITNEDNPNYAFLCCTSYDSNIDTSIGTFEYSCPQNYYISNYIEYYNNNNIRILPNIIVETFEYSSLEKVYIGNNSHNITVGDGNVIIIEDSCYNIYTPYPGSIHIKRDCENLINVYRGGEGTNNIILNYEHRIEPLNIEPLYYFGSNTSGYYKLNIPQEIIDFCDNNRDKIVNVWKSGNNKLCWYHPEIGIINSDI